MHQEKIRQAISDTFRLLWSFKWYVGLYLLYCTINIISLFDIPAADDKIFHAEATSQAWAYANQEVYIGSLRLEIIILILLFLLGTSNMRNHPLLAKAIFLSPWVYMIICLGRLF
ncbi:MAG: hypothetical protein IJ529_01130 [Alphaproteobacteria bacterium]|nr:hypothetical protein [Alphaproteobacteria bacterium]MBQ9234896.1 hypothetical protein [Alphaproteobacteria bacterium]